MLSASVGEVDAKWPKRRRALLAINYARLGTVVASIACCFFIVRDRLKLNA